ncbi:MAG: transcription elongation factor GreA [Candidatus Pacebacteria bacterium]|jgi:transcription elongation factor GreA|nr:transcription elongation factor GreA [Candidatus Paceibacterota bacterium]|tara:strand:+ start:47424 stop:47891 length:468 start_codon:yes stop_codon:yes gene_type:complete
MLDEKEYLTKEKFDELQKELDFLKITRRKEIAENLEYARSLGDISENAEYHEARELQAATEDRINKLDSILKFAKIVNQKSKDAVSLGSTVQIQKEGEKEIREYNIVGSEEANMQERKISHLSPLGEAMMGKKKSEIFSFTTPNGKMNYKIVSIK